jgi:hypothetical protein
MSTPPRTHWTPTLSPSALISTSTSGKGRRAPPTAQAVSIDAAAAAEGADNVVSVSGTGPMDYAGESESEASDEMFDEMFDENAICTLLEQSSGRKLPDAVSRRMGVALGHEFSAVAIHTDQVARVEEAARTNAQAARDAGIAQATGVREGCAERATAAW